MKARHTLLLIIACALNVLPLYLVQIGGDITFHLARIHCHGMQFWQGDLLPRWCFNGDGGVGSPALMFTPPLPYFITSLLYPLRWVGVSVYGVYVLAATLATLLTAFGSYRWLKPVSGPDAALAGALMYVFMPYRQEVLLGTSLFGDLWVLAFAPFMAHAARGMMQRQQGAVWWFVLWTTLAVLSEPAVALCVLLGIGVYVLAHGALMQWVDFALACAAALTLTAFYMLPVVHYIPFVGMGQLHQEAPSFAVSFVQPLHDIKNGRLLYIIGLAGTITGFLCLCGRIWRQQGNISRLPAWREAQVWIVTGFVAIILLFSISGPVWALINAIVPVGFPWRMQAVLLMAVSLLTAVYARWLTRGRIRTIKGDLAIILLLLLCYETVMIVVVPQKDMDRFRAVVAADATALSEYRTQWTSSEQYEDEVAIIYRHVSGEPSHAEIISGTALVNVLQWDWRGMVLEVDAMGGPAQVRLSQRYFPLWQVNLNDGAAVEMKPETGSGYIILAVPQGHHLIRVAQESHLNSIFGRGAHQEEIKKEKQDQPVKQEDFVELQKLIFDVAMRSTMPL